ncbi:MAG: IPT/TIG domain-containing protein, partial [Dehalococcoidia bacterium]
MRKKYPRIVRALLVLALVVSLTGVLAVVPVSAQAPDIDLSASEGAVGSSLTITVNNFQIDSIVTVTFDGVPVATAPTVVEVETDPDTLSIKVPTAPAGTHVIVVTNGPETAMAYFDIVPKVAVTSPASKKGAVGSTATVQGTGFAAGFTVKVTVGGVPFASGISDNTGSVTITGMIPGGLAAGGQPVEGEDLAGNPTSAANEDTFTVTPSLAVSPASGLAGSQVTITGSGWAEGNVVLQFAGGSWETAVASATGIINMTGVVTPPSAAPGVTEVRGTQGSNVATASFTVDARILKITPNKGPMGTTVLLQADKMTPGPAGSVPVNGLVIGATQWNSGTASTPDGGLHVYPFPQPGAINIGTAGQLFPTTAYVP